MPAYIVKSALRHDGKDYGEGKKVSLTEEQAAAIGEAVTPAGAAAKDGNEQKG
jgi:phage gp36-like protein